jgi:hypothetical protein
LLKRVSPAGDLKGDERMADEASHDEMPEKSLPPPTGTIFVLGIYMLALALGWAAMFWMLVDR